MAGRWITRDYVTTEGEDEARRLAALDGTPWEKVVYTPDVMPIHVNANRNLSLWNDRRLVHRCMFWPKGKPVPEVIPRSCMSLLEWIFSSDFGPPESAAPIIRLVVRAKEARRVDTQYLEDLGAIYSCAVETWMVTTAEDETVPVWILAEGGGDSLQVLPCLRRSEIVEELQDRLIRRAEREHGRGTEEALAAGALAAGALAALLHSIIPDMRRK